MSKGAVVSFDLVPVPDAGEGEATKVAEGSKIHSGVHAALAEAKKDRDRAAAEHKEATALHLKIDAHLRKAQKKAAAGKTPAERKLGEKNVVDANAAKKRAERIIRMTKANVEKQHVAQEAAAQDEVAARRQRLRKLLRKQRLRRQKIMLKL